MKLGMGRRLFLGFVLSFFSLGVLAGQAWAVPWFALGPYGGDARSIAADPGNPRHLYLGTANGWVYQSTDGGALWHRLAQIDKRNDLVIDHILVDPANANRLVVGAWTIGRPDGGLFISEDAGKTWYDQAQMRGQAVFSVARGLSDPKELVAGTLKGVFRSDDNGTHWTLISPPGSHEIHEVESIALDPHDGNVIYAGTWHLPWKTTDGGAHWVNIKDGIIDDSDVFSIVVDRDHPNIVYASACSGIYKSENAGGLFTGGVSVNKGQGIPSSARRTRKLMQDPQMPTTVYAGTTEGLYRTQDAGKRWERLTANDVIVNDVYIDPTNSSHVLLATDRGGVLRSDDGGASFVASNTGFSARQVVAYAADPNNPAVLYVGTVNDKTTGGVFTSSDGGVRWEQESEGLGGRDVFSLLTMPGGTVLAGTTHGIFRLEDGLWKESDDLLPAVAVTEKTTASSRSVKGRAVVRKTVEKRAVVATPKRLDEIIYALAPLQQRLMAATTVGLVASGDNGKTWTPMTSLVMPDTRFLATYDKLVLAASLRRAAVSIDAGKTWDTVALPKDVTQVTALCVDEMGNLWLGAREGVYYSTDYGVTWKTLPNLFIMQVDSLHFDASQHRVLMTSARSTFAFSVALPSYKVTYSDAGWNLRFARTVGDHMVGATLYDGMVIEPRMVDSKFADAKTASHAVQGGN
jgi:photosystem II stability/assembly factor-like uncharacterized protein